MRDVNDRTEKDKAGHIYQIMNSPGTEHMLLFLHFILPKIDRLNAQFQSTSLNIHRVSDAIRDGYRGLLSLFVVETKIKSTDVSAIDPSDISIHKLLMDVILGGKCTAKLLEEPL